MLCLTKLLCLCQFRYNSSNPCDMSEWGSGSAELGSGSADLDHVKYCPEAELDFSDWCFNQPEKSKKKNEAQDCVVLSGKLCWADTECRHNKHYLCKKGKKVSFFPY